MLPPLATEEEAVLRRCKLLPPTEPELALSVAAAALLVLRAPSSLD